MDQSYYNGYGMQQQPMVNPLAFNTPQITTNGEMKPSFTIKDENTRETSTLLRVDNDVEDKPKRGRKKKSEVSIDSAGIIRTNAESVSGTVEDTPTAYSYAETTGMLREVLGQIDAVNTELMQEFESVRQSRTMKNKYNTMIGLSENVGSLLSNKIQAIKEINNSINKSNDLDYKKARDRKASESEQDDDRYILDLYRSFISQPQNASMMPQHPLPNINPSLAGSGIIRANISDASNPIDESYLSYVSNLTPEQNLMRYENDPNVKQVVVFDHSTGNKFFQMMNIATGEVIPNVPVYDTAMFMPDTTLYLDKGIAKNLNLNETFPIVEINKGVTSEY